MGRYPTLDFSQPMSPQDRGFLAWTADPLYLTGPSAPASGTPNYSLFKWPGGLLTNVYLATANPLISGTAGQNFIGVYNLAGGRVALSADQTANWAGAGLGNGQYVTPLAAPVYLPAGYYYLGFLQVHTGLGLSMSRAGANTFGLWSGIGVAQNVLRGGNGAGAATALPASMGAITAAQPYWWALT